MRSKFSLKMAERYDCQQVLELLFDDGFDVLTTVIAKRRMQESLAILETSL